jgi:hypothetical protein
MKLLLSLLSVLALGGLSGCVAYGGGLSYGSGVYYQDSPYYGRGYYSGGHRARDSDRDGVPNRYDRDRDGDGVPNRYDSYPNNGRRR